MKLFQNEAYITNDLANENIFAFSLSAWARKVGELAMGMSDKAQSKREHARRSPLMTLLRYCVNGLKSTWDLSKMTDPDHWRFCILNLISISMCFALGYHLDVSVYTP